MISVIIPVYNDVDALRRCLACLCVQTLPANEFEVIVVDNGSTSSPQEVVRKLGSARYVAEPRPGSYNARNSGVRESLGEVLAFTDADCLPSPDWLEKARDRFASDLRVAAIGGRIDLVVSERPTTAELYERAIPPFMQQEYIQRMGFAATANLFVRKSIFLAVGGFDGARMSSGDKEWGRRLIAAGHILEYADDVIVRHPARTTIGSLVRKQRRLVGGRILGPGTDESQLYATWSHRIRTGMVTMAVDLLLRPSRMSLSRVGGLKVLCLAVALQMVRAFETVRLALGARPIR